MLDLIPLPIVWLGFYLIGRLLDRSSLPLRQSVLVLLSVAMLLLGCGPVTCGFYLALCIGVLLGGNLLQKLENPSSRFWCFSILVFGSVSLILVFLQFRVYFLKYFVYLPSLSYLGFRAISYLTTVYRGKAVSTSTAAMQLLFFPMLFMGPISRTENFEQVEQDYFDVLRRLVLGLAMLIAGRLVGEYVFTPRELLHANATSIPCWQFWRSALANAFELYFTFAGYSHLIIGLGQLAGFKLPENFNHPYIATSIGDFWRRWHISLSYWIREYLYIPLGGNRRGIARKCANLVGAMMICGAWHGLEIHYIAWGAYHGVLLAIESFCAHAKIDFLSQLPGTVAKPIRIVRTFALVVLGWLLFLYPMPAFWVHLRGLWL